MQRRYVSLAWFSLAAIAWEPPLRAQCQLDKLTAADAAAQSRFGETVVLEGDTALCGAPFEDSQGFNAGAVYVFVRDAAGFAQTQKLTAADAVTQDRFGTGLALSGDTAIVGSPLDDDAGSGSGSAYVFERSPANFAQTQKLLASDAAASDRFGSAAALSGDTAIVGALDDADGGLGSGSAYVFERGPGGFAESQKLTASDADAFDFFGTAVALDGDTAVVGAAQDDDGGVDSGSVYVFERGPAGWVETQKLTAADGADGDVFGTSVAVHGDLVAVGSDQNGPGAVYVHERTPSGWAQVAKLVAADGADQDQFGTSVSLSGEVVLVGASADDDAGSLSGSAYLFERGPAGWVQTQKLVSTDLQLQDRFGWDVALDGDQALVGAPLSDDAGSLSGSAYTFRVFGLCAAPGSLSIGTGGTQDFALRAGIGHALQVYVLLGSASGTAPGTPVDGVVLPLVADGYFTFTLQNPNHPRLAGSLGNLDALGQATADLTVSPGLDPGLAGVQVHHAFAAIDGIPLVVYASNAVALTLVP